MFWQQQQNAYYEFVEEVPEAVLLIQLLIAIVCGFLGLMLLLSILKRVAAIIIQFILIAICAFITFALAGNLTRTLLSNSISDVFPTVIHIFQEYIVYPFCQWSHLQSYFNHYWDLAAQQFL